MSKKEKFVVKPKNIEVGETYTVRIPNLFYDPKPGNALYYDNKMLVLAKNRDTLVAFDLSERKLPKKDRDILLSLKMRDFIINSKDVVQKYEGDGIVHYIIEVNEVLGTDDSYIAVFLK